MHVAAAYFDRILESSLLVSDRKSVKFSVASGFPNVETKTGVQRDVRKGGLKLAKSGWKKKFVSAGAVSCHALAASSTPRCRSDGVPPRSFRGPVQHNSTDSYVGDDS